MTCTGLDGCFRDERMLKNVTAIAGIDYHVLTEAEVTFIKDTMMKAGVAALSVSEVEDVLRHLRPRRLYVAMPWLSALDREVYLWMMRR